MKKYGEDLNKKGNKVKVLILTEGSKKVGFGHITRCLSLYQAFEERDIKPKFFINGDESILEFVRDTNCEIFNWLKNRNKTFEKIKDSDIVIIDSYLADKDFYDEVSKKVKFPVYIDDTMRIDYPRGIIVNGNIYAKELDYPKKDAIIYLLGPEYLPLRREFWEVSNKEIKKDLKSVIITFGGNDIRNMTLKVLNLLNKDYSKLKKNVIIGRGFHNIKEIKAIADENTNLIYYPDAAQMKQIMLDSDIAISAGGQTLYELARVGTPTIAIAVADNQIGNVKGWEKVGFIKYAGCWKDMDLLKRLEIFTKEYANLEVREKSSSVGRSFVDGKGSKRVVEFVLNLFYALLELIVTGNSQIYEKGLEILLERI